MSQTFNKYSELYRWNQVDHMVLDNQIPTLATEMRFRKLSFGIIPPDLGDTQSRETFVAKIQRLLEYLRKLCDDQAADLGVAIEKDASTASSTTARGKFDSMKRYTVSVKGKGERHEWFQLAVDATFSTKRSFRIIYNWLVASAAKIETQIQQLHRRCTQYGLKLLPFPEIAISRNLSLNPVRKACFAVDML